MQGLELQAAMLRSPSSDEIVISLWSNAEIEDRYAAEGLQFMQSLG
jgi:hypothetical protein